jgi:hypothetical protein
MNYYSLSKTIILHPLDMTQEQASCACFACDSLNNCTYMACICGNKLIKCNFQKGQFVAQTSDLFQMLP